MTEAFICDAIRARFGHNNTVYDTAIGWRSGIRSVHRRRTGRCGDSGTGVVSSAKRDTA